MNVQPIPAGICSDCGTALDHHHGDEDRCPACFDRYLFDIDAGFLENYRRFGCHSPRIVAETCLRALVLDTPDHRKVLAMTIFEQYIEAVKNLAGLFVAFQNRDKAPILKSFLEFRLDARSAPYFFETVQSMRDVELCAALDLPLPGAVEAMCPHLDAQDAYSVAVGIYHLLQDLRKTTDHGNAAALALAEAASHLNSAIIASEASFIEGARSRLTPDQVALLILDPQTRSLIVQGLSADEDSMSQVVGAIDTATRASSNLIYAYLQTKNL